MRANQTGIRRDRVPSEILQFDVNVPVPSFLPEFLKPGIVARSAIAATLIASLEMARNGMIEIKQTEPFGPIFLRAAKPS